MLGFDALVTISLSKSARTNGIFEFYNVSICIEDAGNMLSLLRAGVRLMRKGEDGDVVMEKLGCGVFVYVKHMLCWWSRGHVMFVYMDYVRKLIGCRSDSTPDEVLHVTKSLHPRNFFLHPPSCNPGRAMFSPQLIFCIEPCKSRHPFVQYISQLNRGMISLYVHTSDFMRE